MQAEEEQLVQGVYEKEVEIKNATGLHMRPMMRFVEMASKFNCNVTVSNGPTIVNGKSIMEMCMLAGKMGIKLKIRTEGDDAKEAIEALGELVETKQFDEPGPNESNKKNE